jgi:hypothetical protein
VPAAPLPVMLLQGGNRYGARRRSLPRPSPLPLIGFPQQEIVMARRPGQKAVMVMLFPYDAPCLHILLLRTDAEVIATALSDANRSNSATVCGRVEV